MTFAGDHLGQRATARVVHVYYARLPGAVRRRVQRRGLGAGANLTTRVYIIQPAAAVAAAVQRTQAWTMDIIWRAPPPAASWSATTTTTSPPE